MTHFLSPGPETFDPYDHPARRAAPSKIAGMPQAGRHDHDENGTAGAISEDMERQAITAAFPRREPAVFAEIADHAAWVAASQPSEADEARHAKLADGPDHWDRGAAGSAQFAIYSRALLDGEMTHDDSSALTRHIANARRRISLHTIDPSPIEPPSLLPTLPGYDVAGAQARLDAGKGPSRRYQPRPGPPR